MYSAFVDPNAISPFGGTLPALFAKVIIVLYYIYWKSLQIKFFFHKKKTQYKNIKTKFNFQPKTLKEK